MKKKICLLFACAIMSILPAYSDGEEPDPEHGNKTRDPDSIRRTSKPTDWYVDFQNGQLSIKAMTMIEVPATTITITDEETGEIMELSASFANIGSEVTLNLPNRQYAVGIENAQYYYEYNIQGN